MNYPTIGSYFRMLNDLIKMCHFAATKYAVKKNNPTIIIFGNCPSLEFDSNLKKKLNNR